MHPLKLGLAILAFSIPGTHSFEYTVVPNNNVAETSNVICNYFDTISKIHYYCDMEPTYLAYSWTTSLSMGCIKSDTLLGPTDFDSTLYIKEAPPTYSPTPGYNFYPPTVDPNPVDQTPAPTYFPTRGYNFYPPIVDPNPADQTPAPTAPTPAPVTPAPTPGRICGAGQINVTSTSVNVDGILSVDFEIDRKYKQLSDFNIKFSETCYSSDLSPLGAWTYNQVSDDALYDSMMFNIAIEDAIKYCNFTLKEEQSIGKTIAKGTAEAFAFSSYNLSSVMVPIDLQTTVNVAVLLDNELTMTSAIVSSALVQTRFNTVTITAIVCALAATITITACVGWFAIARTRHRKEEQQSNPFCVELEVGRSAQKFIVPHDRFASKSVHA